MEQDMSAAMPVMSNVSNQNNPGNNKGWQIATIVASVLALCGIGLGIYGIIQSSQKSSVKEPETTVAVVDTVSLKQVKDLLEEFINFDYNVTSSNNNLFDDGLTEQYKYYLALKKINYTNKATAGDGDMADYEYSFTYNDINDAYHDLFGSDSDVKNQEEFWCMVPFYSKEYNKYISNTKCGGYDPVKYAYEILDYSVDGDKLAVNVAYASFPEDYAGGESQYIKDHKNELPEYQLTFKKEGSKYIFTDIEKAK